MALIYGSTTGLSIHLTAAAPSTADTYPWGALWVNSAGNSSTTRLYIGSSTPGTWLSVITSS